jgi:hypothetical protein
MLVEGSNLIFPGYLDYSNIEVTLSDLCNQSNITSLVQPK